MSFAHRYARGKRAKAQCGRCGDVVPYRTLRKDGYIKNYWVCPACYDPKEMQEEPIRTTDPTALHHPKPLLDTGTTEAVGKLTDSLDGGTTFGGGT